MPTGRTLRKPKEILSLSGLRGIAAGLVFLFHASNPEHNPRLGQFPEFLWQVGWSGVTIFFTLSGFLLTALYFEEFKQSLSFNKLRIYWVKRFARIYPSYFIFSVILLLYALFRFRFKGAPPPDIRDWIVHWLMLQGYFQNFATTVIPAAWTLTIEETFYFVLPFFSWLTFNFRGSLFLIPPLLLLIGWTVSTAFSENLGFFFHWKNFTLFGQFAPFLIGALAGFYFRKNVKENLSFSRGLSRGGWILGIAIYIGASWYWRLRVTWMEGFEGSIVFGLCALALILGCLGNTLFTRLLGSRPMVYFGHISYAFYLIHAFVLNRFEHSPQGFSKVFAFLISIFISAIIFELLEKPSRKLIVARWGRV